ncbi:hypothetical protein CY35_09G062900 [Sphagnum magellanicum]|nr:hypothetical protein CY35_09G062900 [Sphagnum magellanicum]
MIKTEEVSSANKQTNKQAGSSVRMEKEKQKESSRRSSWPWKRKSSEKVAATNSFAPHEGGGTFLNSPAAVVEDRQQGVLMMQRWDVHHRDFSVQISPQKDVSPRIVLQNHDMRRQQSEERVKSISEQLANALADITTKDNLVKQHVKVAEEAVSGWEKAEAEAVALKQQLDAAWQQKLATEDRATHLDGALKECMKQLRHVREEQEQLIHDTLVKKTREYDKLRIEMETKLAEASEILSHTRTELLECRAEGKALSHALQERSRSLGELGEAKGRAEADIKILQVQVEAMEKENANLKYEVHVLNKELEIRNGEREYERKAADIAAKQHHESVKKIAQLEEECNRLRLLIRKKLPGPAALQRMRNEVEGFGKPGALENKGRRSFGRSASHLDPVSMGMMKENAHDPGYNSSNGIAERMAAMDEEMKMLREALACRNEELQNAHIRCVKTANRLSLVEEELDKARGVQTQSKQQEIKALIKESPHSTDDISQDASSDTWASSLVATLDQFKKEKSKPQSNGNRQASLRFELMDDFAEMEQLAKMSEPAKSDNTYSDTASFDGPRESPMTTASEQIQELEVELASTRRELESANNTVCDLNAELASAKELLTALQSRNSANEVLLIKLQNQLDQLNKIQSNKERGGDGPSALSDQISGFLIKNSLATGRRESGKTGSALETSSSEGEAPGEYASVSDAESKASTVHTELAASLLKIVWIIEALAQATGSEYTSLVSMPTDGVSRVLGADQHGDRGQIAGSMQWKDPELENAMQSLVLVGNKLLQAVAEQHAAGGAAARMNLNALQSVTLLPNREIKAAGRRSPLKDELPRSWPRFLGAGAGETVHLRTEKGDIEDHLKAADKKVEQLKLQEKERRFPHEIHQDDAPQDSKGLLKEDELLEEELMVLSSVNPRQMLSLQVASGEINHLHEKVAALEGQLKDEQQQHQEVIAKIEDAQHKIHLNTSKSDHSGGSHAMDVELAGHSTSEDEDIKSRKEREDTEIAATALAECQRTILALGRQLNVMGTVPVANQKTTETSVSSSTDSATSIQKLTENMDFFQWQKEAEVVVPCFPDIAKTHNHSPSALREQSSPWVTTGGPRPKGNQSPLIIPGRQQNEQQGSANQSFYGQQHGENSHRFRNDYLDHGAATMSPSLGLSDFSGHGLMSVPASPARSPSPALRSIRMRTNNGPKSSSEDSVLEETPAQKPRTPSSFSRFYSRSRSGSSGSSS